MCGGPVDVHDRQIRFRLPEPVLDSPGQERVPGAWLSYESPEASVMMQIPGVGAFVRALLVVRLLAEAANRSLHETRPAAGAGAHWGRSVFRHVR